MIKPDGAETWSRRASGFVFGRSRRRSPGRPASAKAMAGRAGRGGQEQTMRASGSYPFDRLRAVSGVEPLEPAAAGRAIGGQDCRGSRAASMSATY